MNDSSCVQEDSCPDYMKKAEDCLKTEENRVESYLHIESKPKLLSEVETEVLGKYEGQLLEKEHSGCAALLRDDKVCPQSSLPRICTQRNVSILLSPRTFFLQSQSYVTCVLSRQADLGVGTKPEKLSILKPFSF